MLVLSNCPTLYIVHVLSVSPVLAFIICDGEMRCLCPTAIIYPRGTEHATKQTNNNYMTEVITSSGIQMLSGLQIQ